jgi:hypothetical protein
MTPWVQQARMPVINCHNWQHWGRLYLPEVLSGVPQPQIGPFLSSPSLHWRSYWHAISWKPTYLPFTGSHYLLRFHLDGLPQKFVPISFRSAMLPVSSGWDKRTPYLWLVFQCIILTVPKIWFQFDRVSSTHHLNSASSLILFATA